MTTKNARWNEPAGCTTPRGWCYLDGMSETYDGQKPVGFYLLYPGIRNHRRQFVLASAYVYRNTASGIGTGAQRNKNFATVERAKRWIERTAPKLA